MLHEVPKNLIAIVAELRISFGRILYIKCLRETSCIVGAYPLQLHINCAETQRNAFGFGNGHIKNIFFNSIHGVASEKQNRHPFNEEENPICS
jgi:hypothetical protein